jgi:molybdenum-dependent DNA-binding transcriptional regulator ModE
VTSPKLLVPLRVPELGPYLGKVITGTGRDPGGLDLDALRYRLATRVIEAAGESRRLAARDEREAALAGLGRAVWLEAWEEAVAGVAELLAIRISGSLAAEARAAGMPGRRRRKLEFGPAEEGALAARLGSAGAELVPLLDLLEERINPALSATALERDAMAEWQEALTTSARRLEAAWLELELAVEVEELRWRRVADEVAAWRKPLWPVVLVIVPALGVAVWLGLVLGGYLDAPGWFASAWRFLFQR